MRKSRRSQSKEVRINAAELAANRSPVHHCNNSEEYEYRGDAGPSHIANYTKGLPHHPETGLLLNPVDYKLFVTGIQSGDPEDFRHTPLGPALSTTTTAGVPTKEAITSETENRAEHWQSRQSKDHEEKVGAKVRAWESAGAGNVFDLQGPDAQAVTMPPAPRLDSDELIAETAEVYAMALLRDMPFADFPLPEGTSFRSGENDRTPRLKKAPGMNDFRKAFVMMSELPWFSGFSEDWGYKGQSICRRRDLYTADQLFRGVTPGEQTGPYLSQFLLVGNSNPVGRSEAARDGVVQYGVLGLDLRVPVATPCKDYMTVWPQYVDVQNGADLRGVETYTEDKPRFMTSPRDLASYVHYDALYEAYLNACLFLLSAGAPLDRGIPYTEADTFDKQQGFAHFGGPHILSLVCEVATRALKAVRYQKFNVHRRLRPEAVGGLVDRWMHFESSGSKGKTELSGSFKPVTRLMEGEGDSPGLKDLTWSERKSLLREIKDHNNRNNREFNKDEPCGKDASYLLPMAFAEGSPMHPAYGAGHGTVAGACVTILKAYFDHGWTPGDWMDGAQGIAYQPTKDGSALRKLNVACPLTVEGELNKLAANIAIGRNWAGVHYYSDYIESMRLGEEIAIGMLEEQKLTYPENFTMTVPLFDGGAVQI
ncbi:MAG: vanadium-dependent haloperoxidase [Planctomycetota bacterium]